MAYNCLEEVESQIEELIEADESPRPTAGGCGVSVLSKPEGSGALPGESAAAGLPGSPGLHVAFRLRQWCNRALCREAVPQFWR